MGTSDLVFLNKLKIIFLSSKKIDLIFLNKLKIIFLSFKKLKKNIRM
jgi:hypothetical protein